MYSHKEMIHLRKQDVRQQIEVSLITWNHFRRWSEMSLTKCYNTWKCICLLKKHSVWQDTRNLRNEAQNSGEEVELVTCVNGTWIRTDGGGERSSVHHGKSPASLMCIWIMYRRRCNLLSFLLFKERKMTSDAEANVTLDPGR